MTFEQRGTSPGRPRALPWRAPEPRRLDPRSARALQPPGRQMAPTHVEPFLIWKFVRATRCWPGPTRACRAGGTRQTVFRLPPGRSPKTAAASIRMGARRERLSLARRITSRPPGRRRRPALSTPAVTPIVLTTAAVVRASAPPTVQIIGSASIPVKKIAAELRAGECGLAGIPRQPRAGGPLTPILDVVVMGAPLIRRALLLQRTHFGTHRKIL